ncbi:MAG: uracil-DNA glycosylase [Arenimonas sp.]|nr:uracil-DNA glycosylase [Arenimonas sp.]
MSNGRLCESWQQQVGTYLASDSMQSLSNFIRQERAKGKQIFPPNAQLFAALNATPFEAVKVVILGQDPYHGPGQAHGLSFSVPDGVPPPPSLVNMFKELSREYGTPMPQSGNLTAWASQGVLLLNSVMSVENGLPGSHKDKGWEGFTDLIIQQLAQQRQGIVFMLWGAYAKEKGKIVNSQQHCVLRAPHPSPLSAYRGFIGCGHFSAANRYLQGRGIQPIHWQL